MPAKQSGTGKNLRRYAASWMGCWSKPQRRSSTAALTWSTQWAPAGVQRICWCLFMRVLTRWLTVPLSTRGRDRLAGLVAHAVVDQRALVVIDAGSGACRPSKACSTWRTRLEELVDDWFRRENAPRLTR
jgi:hypothetical protein